MKAFHLYFLVLGLSFTSCVNDLTQVKEVASLSKEIVEAGDEVEIVYSIRGKVRYKIVGDKFIRHSSDNPYIEFTEGVNIYTYDENMQIESKLRANYGINYEREKKMIVRNDVLLINTEGEKLNTEELIWDEKKDSIYTNKFVKITTKDGITYGTGLIANRDFSSYEIQNIKGSISVDED